MNETKVELEKNKEPIFRRGLDSVSSSDLHEIEKLEEGWFVEFKSRSPDSQKLAKSISSFANAYGGLLVIGAEEDSKTRRLKKFLPMSQELVDETKIKIRQAVEAHLQPCPIFFMKTLELCEIPIETNERWILLVHTPKGENAPFLHSNGCIYTRKGDSASPTALTDLGLLDRLWSDGRRKREQLIKRIEFLCSQSSSKIPKIELIISVDNDLSGEIQNDRITFSDFKQIASRSTNDHGNPIFNNTYPLDSSYVARRVQRFSDATSLIWDYDYARKLHYIHIPLATHKWLGDKFDQELVGHETLRPLAPYLLNQQYGERSIFIVDLSPSLMMMSIILSMVNRLHSRPDKQKVRLLANARASGVRNSAIYVDLPRYREHLESSGVPFVHREVDFIYSIEKPDAWFEMHPSKEMLSVGDNSEIPINLDIGNATGLFLLIAESLGISNFVTIGAERHECDESNIEGLIETCNHLLLSEKITFSVTENPGVA